MALKLYVLPYKRGSRAVRQIRESLRAPVIKLINSRWRPRPTRAVINWGHTNPPIDLGVNILNKPEAVANAVNKLTALSTLKDAGISVPKHTHSREIAEDWFQKEGTVVFCRTLLRSSGGKGIVIAESPQQLVRAPLYTRRIRKSEEYRVHVFSEEVIDVVKKRLRNGMAGLAGRNSYVRNHDNGWVFAHDNVNCPDSVKQAAVASVKALGLTFGAVDIGVTKSGLVFVFEVNTAPGLENQQTIAAYTKAFKNYKKKEEEKQNYANINRHLVWR